jgi:two-component sensor histidine kinase
MTPPDPAPAELLDRVLVVAPFRRDADVVQEALGAHGIMAIRCDGPPTLARELAAGTAGLVLSQEALTSPVLDVVAGYLAAQPNWSDLPLVLLLDGDLQSSALLGGLRARLPSSKLTVLQRPVRMLELVTAVQTAVAARRRQLQLRDHMAWQDELQLELNHRVKNVLANVMAIYYMTLRQSDSLEAFSSSFEGRLAALSGVHSALVASAEPKALSQIAQLVLAPYGSSSGERVTIEGPTLELTPQSAVTVALCLHELATNASKYGAFSVPQGQVRLVWSVQDQADGARVLLAWTERGGPPVTPPTRQGYGTAFIRSALRGLKGAIAFDFAPQGLMCQIDLAMERVSAAPG